MKTLISIAIILLCMAAKAQAPDTLFTNEHHNVALFFPDKIRQAVVGAENYIFSYNQEHPQFLGLLKGAPGKSSNLLAITQDGNVYSYVVAYKNQLSGVVYFLDKKASLGNETRQLFPDTSSKKPLTSHIHEVEDGVEQKNHLASWARHYSNISNNILKKKKKNGISLQTNEMIYNGGEVYLVLEISNSSGIDFETEYLRLYLSRGNKTRNSSYQKTLQQPLMKYNFPKIIRHGERKRFVYVLPKFTLGDREKVMAELREKRGNRILRLTH